MDVDWCQGVIDRALELPIQTGTVGFGNQNRVDPDFRTSKIRWLHKNQGFEDVYDLLDWYFKYANQQAFGFDLSFCHELQFTEYRGEDNGHYKWHEDIDWKNTDVSHRKLSMIVQLTDPADYSGGDIQLKRDPIDEKKVRTQGTVLVFPAFLEHQVTNVTQGTRYSLVTWYKGPKFR
jgi:PKHD-type hydroxylase